MQAWSEDGAALVRTWCGEGVSCPKISLFPFSIAPFCHEQ